MFAGKLTVFTAALDGGLLWLVVLGAVNTVASLFYYLRWVVPAVRGEAPGTSDIRPSAARVAYLLAAASLIGGALSGAVLPMFDGALLQ